MKQHFANALGSNPNSQLKCFAIQGFIDFLKVPRDSYSSMTLHACQAHRESPATLDASDGPRGEPGNWQTCGIWRGSLHYVSLFSPFIFFFWGISLGTKSVSQSIWKYMKRTTSELMSAPLKTRKPSADFFKHLRLLLLVVPRSCLWTVISIKPWF